MASYSVGKTNIFYDVHGNEKSKTAVAFFNGMLPSVYGNTFYEQNTDMLDERAKAFADLDKSYLEGQKILYETFKNDVYMTDKLKILHVLH